MSVLVHIMPHHEHPFAAIIEDLWERRAELSADEKDAVSHRGQAVRAVLPLLAALEEER